MTIKLTGIASRPALSVVLAGFAVLRQACGLVVDIAAILLAGLGILALEMMRERAVGQIDDSGWTALGQSLAGCGGPSGRILLAMLLVLWVFQASALRVRSFRLSSELLRLMSIFLRRARL